MSNTSAAVLLTDLKNAKTEEDVKDAYIKALGLTGYSKNLIDIQTPEVWFEAKLGRSDLLAMFAQLIYYVHVWHQKPDPNNPLPNLLCVIDREHAAIMETSATTQLVKDKNVFWPKRGSKPDKKYIDQVRTFVGTHYIEFEMVTRAQEFINIVRDGIKNKKLNRIPITPNNLRIVFDKWVDEIGSEIDGVTADDMSLLFFADIMSDGMVAVQKRLPAQLIHLSTGEGEPAFELRGKVCKLKSFIGYRRFWTIYHRPPAATHRQYMLERRDSLLPLNERQFKGAYYTPLNVVELSYQYLEAALGKRWQTNFYVWDPCCGVGNLEVKHSNYRNIFMSTLDQEDVDIMKSTRTCLGAEIFQYDFLNDDIDSKIDYTLSSKMPNSLQDFLSALKKKTTKKKLLFLMNPPYAEATNYNNIASEVQKVKAKNKTGVTDTKVKKFLMPKDEYGKSASELFTQFLARILTEADECYVATFSTLKYLQAPNFSLFRGKWPAKFLSGFAVPKGKFPIAFAIWKVSPHSTASTKMTFDVYDAKLKMLGKKEINTPSGNDFLNTWIDRSPANTTDAVPLCNGLTITKGKAHLTKWSDNAFAYMHCNANDFSHAEQMTAIYSSVCGAAHGFYINEENFEKAYLTFCARRLERPTWINDRDQFFQPNKTLPKEFKNDCLVWAVFNRTQRTVSTDDLSYKGKNYPLRTFLIPFTEAEVNAPARFDSDFLVEYIKKKKIKFSPEAKEVLSEAKALWKQYFSEKDPKKIRDLYHLHRADVSWFQVRKALETRVDASSHCTVSFEKFNQAYQKLTEKLRPQLYTYGFLRDKNPDLS